MITDFIRDANGLHCRHPPQDFWLVRKIFTDKISRLEYLIEFMLTGTDKLMIFCTRNQFPDNGTAVTYPLSKWSRNRGRNEGNYFILVTFF